MKGASRILGFLHVLRKHVVVLALSVFFVGAAGVIYLARQEPLYEAEVLLRIEQPVPNLLTGGATSNWFAITQAALNTELYLLRSDEQKAQEALTAASADVDIAAGDYSPAALAARVVVETVPGTEGLVRFSLTGSDPVSLPTVVNKYAAVYAQSAEASRSRNFVRQREALQSALETADTAAEAAHDAVARFRADCTDIDLDSGDNPARRERELLAAQVPGLEATALADRLLRRRIDDALAEAGLGVSTGTDDTLAIDGGDPATAAERLADSPFVAGLPMVVANPEVQRLRIAEQEALGRDRKLEEQGLLAGHERRVAECEAVSRARRLRVRVISNAIVTSVAEFAARADHLAATRRQMESAAAEEERVAGVLARFHALERTAADAERARDVAADRLRDLKGLFLPTEAAGGAGGGVDGAGPGLRIAVQVPAAQARQVAPRAPLVIGMTIFAALATGLGLAFVLEYLDDTIRSRDDFERTVGLPLLGYVPRISGKEHANADLAAASGLGSAVAESFRAIRTSILFSRGDRGVRTLLVTSAGPGEGKTTVATNLAIVFARQKGPVLLVDGDLRRPRVAKALGIESEIGLTNLLVGDATLDEVVRETSVEGLHVVTSGPIPPNPAELLHGDAMRAFLATAAKRYERIVIDTPPLVAVTDARVLAGMVDGFYLVISMGRTSGRLIQRAVESVTSIGCDVHGAILNNMAASEERYGDYYHYYRRDPRQDV